MLLPEPFACKHVKSTPALGRGRAFRIKALEGIDRRMDTRRKSDRKIRIVIVIVIVMLNVETVRC